MMWHVTIDAENGESLQKNITIDATDWYSALRKGLKKHGVDGKVLASLSCDVQPDKRVVARDSVTRKVFLIEPVEKPIDSTKNDGDRETSGAYPPHTVFFMRDDLPDDGSGILYRERLIAVDGGAAREVAARLINHYYKQLRAMRRPRGIKRFITVQVYDHTFSDRAERPAIAALSWKEWHRGKPKILFPLSGDEGITFSKASPKRSDGSDSSPKVSSPEASSRRISSTPIPTPAEGVFGVSDKMIAAFERMQDIFTLRGHDEAAAFVLSLSRELVECDAGRCMLISPGKYELYVAAEEGLVADKSSEQTLSLRRGIVGFAANSNAVVVVNDPENDDRLDEDIDQLMGYEVRNLLCAPIQYEGETVGVIELFNSPRGKSFLPEDANILSYLGTSFAEYVRTSLPSREADFTDQDFSDLEKKKKRRVRKKKAARRSPQRRPSKVRVKASKKKTAKPEARRSKSSPPSRRNPKSKTTKK